MTTNIGTNYVNGFSCPNNCVKSESDYTQEELNILYAGGEVPSEWDEDGNVTAYDFISEEEE